MKKKFLSIIIFLMLTAPLFPAGNREIPDHNSRIITAVSILPQKYFVDRIGGNAVQTMVLVLPGESPATYEPTPGQISNLSRADLLFTIGVPFERAFIPKIHSTLKNLPIIDTSTGIKKRTINGRSSTDPDTMDPHIWMSPSLVKIQISTILQALINIAPEKKDYFIHNYDKFIQDLDKLDSKLQTILAPIRGSILFVYHPSFGYFADRYGLKQTAIETGGKAPGPKTLSKIINEVKNAEAKVIFVQPEFQQHSVHVISAATGAAIIPIDPLEENYMHNLTNIAEILADSLK